MLCASKMLVIDLTTQTYRTETIPEKILTDYLGGRGLGAYLLYHSIGAGIDPLSPENPLIFTAGLAQGIDTPFSPKAVVTTKSPLTQIYLFSVSSGAFGHTIRKAGYMAIMIKGKSERPVYLRIDDDKVEFRDARHLWGMKTLATQNAMLKESGNPKACTAAIGPGGEKLIKYAAIMNDRKTFRAFGRGGGGCVMGSKNLKGIVISGSSMIQPGDPERFKEVKQKVREALKENRSWAELRRTYGTGEDMPVMNQLGFLPTRNWKTGVFETDKLSGIAPTMNKDRWPRKNIACGPFCLSPCSHYIKIDDGPYKGASCDGPEYETMYVFGSNCGIDQFDTIVAAAEICDEYGIDTISAGLTISFLMECFEKGLINTSQTDGIPLKFGNGGAMIECLRKIVSREGAGYLWGEGTRRLSAEIPGSSDFAMHCKGLEMGGYECRGLYGQALEFALNPKGGDHHGIGLPARVEAANGTGRNIKGKGIALKKDAIDRILGDSLVVCCFPRKVMTPVFETLVTALRGIPSPREYLDQVGMRILTQERLFNTREGLRRKDDLLPERLLKEPLPDGPNKGSTVPLEELKDDAYAAFGWDLSTGIPEEGMIKKLGITL
ncbi:MAG: aldehyde ferredoxin oxidoreductase family protein [Thermodesulfobacteriota bacterium]